MGYAETSPLSERDLDAVASFLETKRSERGEPVFHARQGARGVWIVRSGMLELAAGAGRHKAVIQMLYPGGLTETSS